MNLTSLLAHLFIGLLALGTGYAVCQKQVSYVQVVKQATPAISLVSSANPAGAGTSVTFTAQVRGTAATPSGNIVFLDGASQLGVGSVDGSGMAACSTSALAAGSHPITAYYGGDNNYTAVASSQLMQSVVVTVAPVVDVSLGSTSLTTGQTLTVTISVSGASGKPLPTGFLTLVNGSAILGSGPLVNGTAVIVVAIGALPVGADTLTANYTPDASSALIYKPASMTVPVSVTPQTPGFTLSGTSVTVPAGAMTGNSSTITVTPTGGFTGPITLSAVISTMPSDVVYIPSYSFGGTSPVTIGGSSPGQATLTFLTKGRIEISQSAPPRPSGRWWPVGGIALACVLLFGIPAPRRGWQSMLRMLLLLPILAAGATACVNDNWVASKGAYTVTVTGVSGTIIANTKVTLTVQ